jgi:hypothetical protein
MPPVWEDTYTRLTPFNPKPEAMVVCWWERCALETAVASGFGLNKDAVNLWHHKKHGFDTTRYGTHENN